MYTLDITDAAEQDLDRITDYLGVTLANPQAALALISLSLRLILTQTLFAS